MVKTFPILETPFQGICRAKGRDAFCPTWSFFSVDVSYEQFQNAVRRSDASPTDVLFLTLIPRFLGPLQ